VKITLQKQELIQLWSVR